MKLKSDDHIQVYVWVDEKDETIQLSPRFDYEEDAILWKERVSSYIMRESGFVPDDWK